MLLLYCHQSFAVRELEVQLYGFQEENQFVSETSRMAPIAAPLSSGKGAQAPQNGSEASNIDRRDSESECEGGAWRRGQQQYEGRPVANVCWGFTCCSFPWLRTCLTRAVRVRGGSGPLHGVVARLRGHLSRKLILENNRKEGRPGSAGRPSSRDEMTDQITPRHGV